MRTKFIVVASFSSREFPNRHVWRRIKPPATWVVQAGLHICRNQVGENAKNEVGPVLNGIIGGKAGTAPSYEYSPGFKNTDLVWDDGSFRECVKDRNRSFPATKMAFARTQG